MYNRRNSFYFVLQGLQVIEKIKKKLSLLIVSFETKQMKTETSERLVFGNVNEMRPDGLYEFVIRVAGCRLQTNIIHMTDLNSIVRGGGGRSKSRVEWYRLKKGFGPAGLFWQKPAAPPLDSPLIWTPGKC